MEKTSKCDNVTYEYGSIDLKDIILQIMNDYCLELCLQKVEITNN